MYAYVTDALVQAMAREREEEARKTRPHAEGRPKTAQAVTSVKVFRGNRC
jgi:hypothetical protein